MIAAEDVSRQHEELKGVQMDGELMSSRNFNWMPCCA